MLNQSQKKKPQKAMDAGARLRRKKLREEHRRYVNDIIPDHLKDEYMPIIEAKNKCGKGEYYCREDKKCKPIPEGSKINKDGTLVSEAKSPAWTRKSGKNKSGGLNEKGRKSYERENPGSDLKAPSKKVGNPRRASFCARMKGMKKKLTSKKTASDPDSRINKSLRAWNC